MASHGEERSSPRRATCSPSPSRPSASCGSPPIPWREFIRQSWFIASVSMLPAVLVSIAFGATIALQVGNVARQLGAESQTGAAMVLAVVREAAPIVAALLIAGAGGSAMCADIGSRKIRDEISAMEVLAVNPIKTLVVPRIWAAIFVAMLLDGFVSVAGIAGGYFFNVVIQGGTPGAYLASFSLLAQTADLVVAIMKAGIFGLIAAMVAVLLRVLRQGRAQRCRRRRQPGRRRDLHADLLRELHPHGAVLRDRPAEVRIGEKMAHGSGKTFRGRSALPGRIVQPRRRLACRTSASS